MLLLTEKIEKTYLVRNFLLTNLNEFKLGAWPLVKTRACLLRFSALELWPSGWRSTQASCYAWGHRPGSSAYGRLQTDCSFNRESLGESRTGTRFWHCFFFSILLVICVHHVLWCYFTSIVIWTYWEKERWGEGRLSNFPPGKNIPARQKVVEKPIVKGSHEAKRIQLVLSTN